MFSILFYLDMNIDLLVGFERIKRDYEVYDLILFVIKNCIDMFWVLFEEIMCKIEYVKMNVLLLRERKFLV